MDIPNICPCCGYEVVKTSNTELYWKEYGNGVCYLCRNCKASVGTRPNGETLGVLANAEMKRLKKLCYAYFDLCWKSRKIKRGNAYKTLSKKLNISVSDCHFGHFDVKEVFKNI